jgi:hypothetical protein
MAAVVKETPARPDLLERPSLSFNDPKTAVAQFRDIGVGVV